MSFVARRGMNVSITVRMWCSLLSPYKYPHVQYIWVIIQLNQQMKRQKSSYAEKNELIVRFYCSLVQKRAATNENNKDIVKNTLYSVPESKVTSFFCLNQLSKTQRLFVYYHGCRRKKANLYIQEAGTKNAFVIQKIGKIQLLKFVFFRSTYSVDLQLQFGIAEFKIHPTHTAPDLTGTLASDTHHLIMRTWKKRSKTHIQI